MEVSFENKMNLADIGIDCQILILDRLNFHDQLAIAQTSKHFSYVASDIFRRRYATKTFSISYRSGKKGNISTEVTESQFIVKNHETALIVLKTFKHLIQSMQIEYTFIGFNDRKELQEVIEKHCCNLNVMELKGCDEFVFQHFLRPLPSVNNLTITGELTTMKSPLKLNEIFQNLRSLFVEDWRISHTDHKVLGVVFPKLEYFSTTSLRGTFLNLAIMELVQRNPQIQSFTMIDCHSFDYLRAISEHLPNLEWLNIVWDKVHKDFTGDKIRFANVKTLSMVTVNFDVTEMLRFDRLEHLQIQCKNYECIDFAVNYPNLTKLSIDQLNLNDGDLARISNILLNLKELSIKFSMGFEPDSIVKFIERCRQLEFLHLQHSEDQDNSKYQSWVDEIMLRIKETAPHFDGKWNIFPKTTGIFLERI